MAEASKSNTEHRPVVHPFSTGRRAARPRPPVGQRSPLQRQLPGDLAALLAGVLLALSTLAALAPSAADPAPRSMEAING